MKTSKQERNLLFYLLGIGLIALAYFVVLQPCNEKTTALKVSNGTLQATLTRLETLDKQKTQYQKEMKEFEKENEEIQNRFNPMMKFEDYLLFIKEFEDKYDVFMTKGTVASGVVQEIAYPTVEGVDSNVVQTENIETVFTDSDGNEIVYSNPAGLFLINRVVDIEFETTYTDVKKYIDFILENEDIMEIESISLTYEAETGELTGNAVINSFSLYGNGKEYKAPVIQGIGTGVKNLFGTYTAPVTQ